MTGRAVGAEQPRLEGRIAVTRVAVLRRALENIAHMALSAVDRNVRPGQRKSRLGMIDCRSRPTTGRVALAAVLAQAALVCIVGLVAVGEQSRHAGEQASNVQRPKVLLAKDRRSNNFRKSQLHVGAELPKLFNRRS